MLPEDEELQMWWQAKVPWHLRVKIRLRIWRRRANRWLAQLEDYGPLED